jgi:hypothetical protein
VQFAIDYRGEVEFSCNRGDKATHWIPEPESHNVITAGAIGWRAKGGTLTVRFRPSFTTSEARDRATAWLSGVVGLRVHLAYWAERTWHHEIINTGNFAARRLESLVSHYGGGETGSVKQREKTRQKVNDVFAFRRALELWQERRERFNLLYDGPLLDSILHGGGTLFRATTDGDYELVRPGHNVIPASRKWMERHAGARLSQFPVRAYARALSTTFDCVAASCQPKADEVDLLTTWPGQPRRRSGYHRLVLPIPTHGETFFLSALIQDFGISLLD